MSLKIFYLDDEKELTEVFSDFFSSPKIEIRISSDPTTVIQEIQAFQPDLIFLDYRLPNITGDQVAMLLDPLIPKALVTGDLLVKPKSNFKAHFEKPLDLSAIAAFIETYSIKKEQASGT